MSNQLECPQMLLAFTMPDRPVNRSSNNHAALREILLQHVADLGVHEFPGTDGFTEQDVLREYPNLALSSVVPNRDELIDEHPELRETIEMFFAKE